MEMHSDRIGNSKWLYSNGMVGIQELYSRVFLVPKGSDLSATRYASQSNTSTCSVIGCFNHHVIVFVFESFPWYVNDMLYGIFICTPWGAGDTLTFQTS